MELLGIFFVTTAFEPILTLFPISISPKIAAFKPISTLSTIVGCRFCVGFKTISLLPM